MHVPAAWIAELAFGGTALASVIYLWLGEEKADAAVVAIVGALELPLIHMSVYWFRSLHPEPVVLRPEGPTADPEIVVTLLSSMAAYTVLFLGLFILRYRVEMAERDFVRQSPVAVEVTV